MSELFELDEEYVVFYDVKATRDAGSAMLVEIDAEEYWIPYSQIHDNSEVQEEGDEGELIVTEWLAIKKGLID